MATERPDPLGEADSLLDVVNRGQRMTHRLHQIGELLHQLRAGTIEVDAVREQLLMAGDDIGLITEDETMARHRYLSATFSSILLAVEAEAPDLDDDVKFALALRGTHAHMDNLDAEPDEPDLYDMPDVQAEAVEAVRMRI